jgi:dipeptidyl-peptidase-4
MKRIVLSMALLCLVWSSVRAEHGLVLDSVVTGVYEAAAPAEMTPMLDGRYYTSLDPTGQRIVRYSYQTGKQTDVLMDLKTVKGKAPASVAGYVFSPTESKILVWTSVVRQYRRSWTADYYVFDCRRNTLEPLSENGPQRDACFSPDGRSVAFARNNDLFIKRLDFGTEIAVTSDGSKNGIINGVTDWVYEEEFGYTRAFDWSPDSKFLAFLRFNESQVSTYTYPLYGAFMSRQKQQKYYPSFNGFKYPSAGERNSTLGVWAFNLQTRSSKRMEVPMEEDDYIPRIRFTRNSNQLAVMTLNRSQNAFRMYYLNPKSASATLVLNEQSETYIEPDYDAIRFTTRYFTYLSEKNGYRHLYLYGANGGVLRTLTSGDWDVTRLVDCDTVKNVFYYQSDEPSPMQRAVYSVDLKGKKVCLTPKKGSNDLHFNADFSFYVHSWSDINTPPVYTLYNAEMLEVRSLESNKALRNSLSELKLSKKQFVRVPLADGVTLNGWMLKPADFDEKKNYPVVMVPYGGPDSQMVLDAFDMDWEYYLSQKGYWVVCVDGRGTGGRGKAFRQASYPKLGLLESTDQVAVAQWLKTQPGVDGSRIGIWGWSFGGYLTLMGMTDAHSPFKAGVAVAPVCDWRYYNTIYTERYLKTPAENESAYDETSPLCRADKLQGRLLLIHGLADDNVRANQSLDFSEALIRKGIQFDTQWYPTSAHSIWGATYRKHLYHRMVDFFLQNL